jgi:hypothetical protein
MKILTNNIKFLAMEEKYMRWAKIIPEDSITEQTNIFKYMGRDISMYKMNMNVD